MIHCSRLPFPVGSGRSVQLHFSFSAPQLQVLLKHLRNIYMPDGSAPAASVTISLHAGAQEVSSHTVQSQARTSAPIFNHLVQFLLPQLNGFSLRIVVKCKGMFLGQLHLPLSSAPLHQDVWYDLGA